MGGGQVFNPWGQVFIDDLGPPIPNRNFSHLPNPCRQGPTPCVVGRRSETAPSLITAYQYPNPQRPAGKKKTPSSFWSVKQQTRQAVPTQTSTLALPSTHNTTRHLCIAKRRPSAATVFSPPDSCSMSRKRFIGGMALNLTPPRYGSSGLSRLRKAFPPRGCLLLRVRSWSRGG